MNKNDKNEFVTWIKEEMTNAQSAVMADYRGLTVAQMTDLRRRCREAGVQFKVVKNTLMDLAVKETPMSGLEGLLTGPSALAWHHEDPGAPARILADYAKEKGNEALEIKGGAAGGRALDADQVKNVLAKMETREELLAKTAMLIVAGPTKLARVLAAGPNKLGRVLGALQEKKEAA